LDFKTACAANCTLTMAEEVSKYILSLNFSIPIHYINLKSDINEIRKNEIDLNPSIFEDCPSIRELIRAIEKRISRSSSINTGHKVVPICITLLCSNLYTVNSSIFKDIPDTTVEYCWECLESVSHSVNRPLQEWLTKSIAGRTCVEYSTLYCRSLENEEALLAAPIKMVPDDAIDKRMKFEQIDMRTLNVHDNIWHRDDVICETISAHMLLVSRHLSQYGK
jgi:hypothetical protein